MTPLARRLGLLFALVGLAASAASLYVHHRLLLDAAYPSPCDISATFSCSAAYLSPYGSLFGVPVALLGVVWFVFATALIAWGGRRQSPIAARVPAYLLVASSIGLAMIVYLAYATFFVLHEFCLFCLITWMASIGLWMVSAVANQVKPTSVPRLLGKDLGLLVRTPLALAALACLLVAGAGGAVWLSNAGSASAPGQFMAGGGDGSNGPASASESEFERGLASLPRVSIPVSTGGSAVTIVKFTDFQCPLCGRTYYDYKPLLQKYEAEFPGAVRLVSKNYPLAGKCNRAYAGSGHVAACESAAAVALAAQQGREAEMEAWLYGAARFLTPELVRQAVASIGGVASIDAGLARAQQQVNADVEMAILLNVKQTPSFFVNGLPFDPMVGLPYYDSKRSLAYLDRLIRFELKRAGKIAS